MTHTHIRAVTQDDLPALALVVDQTGLFPGEMLPDLAASALAGEEGALFLTGLRGLRPVGFCYAVQETLADSVWNMLALGVLPEFQREGLGAQLVQGLEEALRGQSQRMIIVDTSGTDAFDAARRFYIGNGYEQEARIRDYWAEGDDKLTFRKMLKLG